jgi:hypothetical protein
MNNILDTIKCPGNFDAIPNPLYAGWVYHWLKSRGADVERITPKFCYAEFIREYPEHVPAFLAIAEATENRQADLDKRLMQAGILDAIKGVEI